MSIWFTKSNRADLSDVIPRIIRYRCWRSKSCTYIAITGGSGDKIGTGKTALAVKIAEMCDPDFTEDDVCHNEKEFLLRLEAADRSRKFGRFIILDESEQIIDSKRYMSRLNQVIRYTLATSRVFRPVLIFVTPMFSDIDASVRKMMNYWIVPQKQPKEKGMVFSALCYEISTGLVDGEMRLKRLLVRDCSKPGFSRMVRVNRLILEPPSEALWKKVEDKSIAFKRKLRDDMLAEIVAEEKERNPEPEKVPSLEKCIDDVLVSATIREFLNRGKSITASDVRLLVPSVPSRYAGLVAKMASARYKKRSSEKKKEDVVK